MIWKWNRVKTELNNLHLKCIILKWNWKYLTNCENFA